MRAVEISRSALNVEWQRLQVIAQNLANLNTTRTANGEPFRPMRLLSGPDIDFATMMARGGRAARDVGGVRVMGMEASGGNLRRVHEPGHPHADAQGFVSYPDIDHAGEMTLMIKTSRAYEANLTTMNIARQMYARALDIGKR
ncbi:MAG TPA: flagellar basal body rod protein FlgC [Sphingomonadaceae bacterium]|nr:flagellar basal body rod protein FlgC [Sphingomonadaceae bacterium]